MSLIVAARFDAFPDAEAAGRQLFSKGFQEDDVSIFFVNPGGQHAVHPLGGDETADKGADKAHKGAIAGAAMIAAAGAAIGALLWSVSGIPAWTLLIFVAVGGYIGSLGGAMVATRKTTVRPARRGQATGIRRAGVLIAVHVQPDSEALAAQTLRDAGGMDVEKAGGRWRNGDWVDFDPVKSPVLSDKVPAQQTV